MIRKTYEGKIPSIVRFLEEQAAGVAILGWDLGLSEATAKELDSSGKKVIAIKCNVADSQQVKEAINQVTATKAALQGFTRTVAKELIRENVRMNFVAPAYMDTEIMLAG